jgi:16S rRNA (cytidine1402-2'-O)-methyltransferase
MAETLFVVATPIGNLEDITLRALRVLREVDLIACEDTRQTAKLLNHYQIQKPMTSYHEHNEVEKAAYLVGQLRSGKDIALVTDSGTPCISDPGYRIVRAAQEAGIRVVPVPGACSLIAALSVSGRPTDAFTFLGFFPARKGARQTFLQRLSKEQRTLIFYESPGRLLESLADIEEILGDRQLTIAREMTKIYEEVFFGAVAQARQHFSLNPLKGEIVVIVEKAAQPSFPLHSFEEGELRAKLDCIMGTDALSTSAAIKKLSQQLGTSRRELYRILAANRKPPKGAT